MTQKKVMYELKLRYRQILTTAVYVQEDGIKLQFQHDITLADVCEVMLVLSDMDWVAFDIVDWSTLSVTVYNIGE